MPSVYIPKKDGLYHDPKTGRTMQHEHYATRIYWSTDMLDYLRRHFPTMLNEELAGCLGVSPRTMIRKARELGLKKNEAWLQQVWDERRRLAHVISKRKGYPGGFVKGVRNNPDGEFKPGHKESDETKAKRIESIKRWCRSHPKELNERAVKIRETRLRNSLTKCRPLQPDNGDFSISPDFNRTRPISKSDTSNFKIGHVQFQNRTRPIKNRP